MTTTGRLTRVAVELREAAESVERLASAADARPGPGSLVGRAELAELAGVQQNTVVQWGRRRKLPEPYATLASGPIWLREDILDWLAGRDVS